MIKVEFGSARGGGRRPWPMPRCVAARSRLTFPLFASFAFARSLALARALTALARAPTALALRVAFANVALPDTLGVWSGLTALLALLFFTRDFTVVPNSRLGKVRA